MARYHQRLRRIHMPRLDLLCALAFSTTLAGCSAEPTTSVPAVHEVRYSGTVSSPAAGGFLVYKISGVWQLDDRGALVSGADTTQIIDAKVYGYPGAASIVLKTQCVALVGKEAWAQQIVVSSSDPQFAAVGSLAVVHLSAAGGAVRGGGGPRDVWYPSGNVCVDKPTTLPLFDMVGGSITMP